jgi:hypothetical protein
MRVTLTRTTAAGVSVTTTFVTEQGARAVEAAPIAVMESAQAVFTRNNGTMNDETCASLAAAIASFASQTTLNSVSFGAEAGQSVTLDRLSTGGVKITLSAGTAVSTITVMLSNTDARDTKAVAGIIGKAAQFRGTFANAQFANITNTTAMIQALGAIAASVEVVTADGVILTRMTENGITQVRITGFITDAGDRIDLSAADKSVNTLVIAETKTAGGQLETAATPAQVEAVAKLVASLKSTAAITTMTTFGTLADTLARQGLAVHMVTQNGTELASTVEWNKASKQFVLTGYNILGQRIGEKGKLIRFAQPVRFNAEDVRSGLADAVLGALVEKAKETASAKEVRGIEEILFRAMDSEAKSHSVNKILTDLKAADNQSTAAADIKKATKAFDRQMRRIQNEIFKGTNIVNPCYIVLDTKSLSEETLRNIKRIVDRVNGAAGYTVFVLGEVALSENDGVTDFKNYLAANLSTVDKKTVRILTNNQAVINFLIEAKIGIQVVSIEGRDITDVIGTLLPAILSQRGIENSVLKDELKQNGGVIKLNAGRVAENVDEFVESSLQEDANY